MPAIIPTNYATLSAMITPAVFFMTANGSLIISTSNRMSRIVDRVRVLNELGDGDSCRARPTSTTCRSWLGAPARPDPPAGVAGRPHPGGVSMLTSPSARSWGPASPCGRRPGRQPPRGGADAAVGLRRRPAALGVRPARGREALARCGAIGWNRSSTATSRAAGWPRAAAAGG